MDDTERDAVGASARLRELLTRQTLAIERYRASVARRLGLSDVEMGAIAYLAQTSSLTPGELRARLVLSSGGTTALIQRLVRSGHVERAPHPHDGRSVVVSLTSSTRATLERHAEPLSRAIDAVAAELSPGERQMVREWLGRIVVATEAKLAQADDADEHAGPPWSRGTVSNAWF
jgi:DNA-binding MarR family transcriptional regulator